MDPHPGPPADLHSRKLAVVIVPTSATLWRKYLWRNEPVFFGRRAANRFDDPARGYGVLYAAESDRGAFVESVGWDTGRSVVAQSELERSGFLLFRRRRALRLFDLDGPSLKRMRADVRLIAGDDHGLSRLWSTAFQAHPAQVDGLRYRARHDPQEYSLALFDRCASAIVEIERRRMLDPAHAVELGALLDRYQMSIL